jgi:hypothetical protein
MSASRDGKRLAFTKRLDQVRFSSANWRISVTGWNWTRPETEGALAISKKAGEVTLQTGRTHAGLTETTAGPRVDPVLADGAPAY